MNIFDNEGSRGDARSNWPTALNHPEPKFGMSGEVAASV